MKNLAEMMVEAGIDWPDGVLAVTQHRNIGTLYAWRIAPGAKGDRSEVIGRLPVSTDDDDVCLNKDDYDEAAEWANAQRYTNPDYMREQQRLAARNTERRDLVRELMLRHPELTGPQAIEQADEILSTLEGMK